MGISSRRWIGSLFAGVLLFGTALTVMSNKLKTEAAPRGVLDLERARSAEAARTILASWDDRLPLLRWQLWIDYGLMVCYGALLVMIARAAARALADAPRTFLRIVALAGGALGLAAALADAVENYWLLRMIEPPLDYSLAVRAATAATIKWSLLGVSVVLLGLAWAQIIPARRLLRGVLVTKIVGTIVLFCLPMLLLGQDCLARLYGLRPEPLLMAWLVGGAYAALVVGYAGGLAEARRDRFPAWVVAMGLVSNGAGFIFAILAVATGMIPLLSLRPFGLAAIGFAGLIALGLIVCLIRERRRAV